MLNDLVLIVCGGRHYDDEAFLFATLDAIHARNGVIEIREGGAAGADALAREWARSRGVYCRTVAAEWRRYGKRAGPLRNGKMLAIEPKPHGVVAFEGNHGTADMCNQGRDAGVTVWEPRRAVG